MSSLPNAQRRRRGARAFQSGLAAEASVRRWYETAGGQVLAERWRRREGEIDLVVQMAGALVFVEVKSGALAAHAIGERQWSRLEAAATRYMLENMTGDAIVRFDAALVAPDGTIEIIENARVN